MLSPDVVFVIPGKTDAELNQMRALDVDRDWRFFEDGIAAWIVQTYLLLREQGQSVELGAAFSRNAINIAHVAQLARLQRPAGCFVVGVRADYPPVRWCHYHIVQNQTQIGPRSIWLPHWPQPGLITRDPSRGDQVQRVAYFGRAVNHYTRFFHRASGYFRVRDALGNICSQLGLDLVERGPECWNDFSDVDVVVGLREFGNHTFDTKPPTKLINAWLAGTVFIGGADSAYFQVGTVGKNYLMASTQLTCQRVLEALLAGRIRYHSLVMAGSNMAAIYDRIKTNERWLAVLNEIFKLA